MPPKTKSNADARARAQARREALRKAERNRRIGFLSLWGTVGLVVVLVVVLLFVFQSGKKSDTKNVNVPASQALVQDLATVPASLFQSIGTTGLGTTVAPLQPITGDPITTDGKPTFVYVGGEFCPYCAAQRWVMVVALDRFGSFTGLETSKSAANDGDYATLTFVNATYTSDYLVFDGKEIYDRARKDLQKLDSAATASYSKFGQVGSVPYFSLNNQYKGSYQFDPASLGTTSADDVAAQIKAGQTPLAKQIIAASNVLTAGICKTTGQKPASVCSAPEVVAAAATGLGATSSSTGSSGS